MKSLTAIGFMYFAKGSLKNVLYRKAVIYRDQLLNSET